MKVVIVDDHPVVRRGVQQALTDESDMEVVGVAGSCPEGIASILALKPDVAIVDMKMPGGSGLDLVREVRKEESHCRFVILTSYVSQENVAGAVSCGVEGYVLKEALPEELISAVRLVFKGGRYYDPEVMRYMAEKSKDDPLDRSRGVNTRYSNRYRRALTTGA